jgi:two-component system sporulation sensor kinase B
MITAILIEYILKNIKQKDHYVKTEKLRVVGELAAGVSHEINNPLTVTYGFLQLLGEESLTPAERKKYITLALEELNRTHEIMENYLILANPYQEQIEKVNLKEEMQLIGEKLQGYAILQGVSITINCPQNLYLECERKKLQQVILNIAKNAIEAMDSGGILFIEFIQKKHHIIMNFQDNGIGMSPEQISKLGEPYFSSNTKGTGIGLMVAYRIIQSLGGTIQVASQINEGTDIKVILPVSSK